MSDLIPVGAIAGAYGVRGEVRIKSYCAQPEDIENYAPLWSEDRSRKFVVECDVSTRQGHGWHHAVADLGSRVLATSKRDPGLDPSRLVRKGRYWASLPTKAASGPHATCADQSEHRPQPSGGDPAGVDPADQPSYASHQDPVL